LLDQGGLGNEVPCLNGNYLKKKTSVEAELYYHGVGFFWVGWAKSAIKELANKQPKDSKGASVRKRKNQNSMDKLEKLSHRTRSSPWQREKIPTSREFPSTMGARTHSTNQKETSENAKILRKLQNYT